MFAPVSVTVCFSSLTFSALCNRPPSAEDIQASVRHTGGEDGVGARWMERNNEVDGPREVMTAGRPRCCVMDDKCSVSMSVSVAAARLCPQKSACDEL